MSITRKRWIFVAAGILAMLCMGCINAWGLFVVPLEEAYGWSRTETSLAFTLQTVFYSLGVFMTGVLNRKMSYRLLATISAIMMGIGFVLSGYATQSWQVCITFSFLCGGGMGLGYNCVISTIPRWFPEKSGSVSGMLLLGYAISSGIFGSSIQRMIAGAGTRASFRVLGIACLAGIFLASRFLKKPEPQQEVELPQPKRTVQSASEDVPTGKAVRRPVFWMEFVLGGFSGGIGLILINHVAPITTESLAMTASMAALVVSINSVANAAGRLSWGLIFDRKGLGFTLTGIAGVSVVGLILAAVSLWNGWSIPFVAACLLVMFAFGGNATMTPTTVRALFGDVHFSFTYSVMALNSFISASLPTIAGTMRQGLGSYNAAFGALILIGIVNLALAAGIAGIRRKKIEGLTRG